MVGSAGTRQPAESRSQACRRACPAHDAGVHLRPRRRPANQANEKKTMAHTPHSPPPYTKILIIQKTASERDANRTREFRKDAKLQRDQHADAMKCLAQAFRFLPLVVGLGAVIAGGVTTWLGLPMFLKLTALDVDADFPLMQTSTLAECSSGTDECLPGQCIVVALWTRPVGIKQECGSYCARDVCYDDWIAQFAWVGGPFHGKPEVEASALRSRLDKSCDGDCERYGGWALDAVVNRSNFTSAAVSQGWRMKRCTDCTCDDGSSIARPNDQSVLSASAEEGDGILLGKRVPCRVPKGAVEDVPDVYDCPSPLAFNSICARLGNLPQIELDVLERGVVMYATIGFVLVPGGVCLLALGVIALRAKSDENQGSARVAR